MGETVSLINGANLRMHRMVFCTVIIFSVARHTVVSAYLEFYPAFRRSVKEPALQPENNWDRDLEAKKYILARLEKLFEEQRIRELRLYGRPPPEFTYHFPAVETQHRQNLQGTFAVPPSDPRYYQPDEVAGYNSIPILQEDNSFDRSPKAEKTTEDTFTDDNELVTKNVAEINNNEVTEQKIAGPSLIKAIFYPDNQNDIFHIALIAGVCVAALVSLISLFFVFWYKFVKNAKATADVEYPAYGVTGPNKEMSPTGDRRLAHSAQMYHYQHQKQQIIAMESSQANNERRGSVSEADSDEENEEGDYTVYECPGLAATGEMEVKNPLFQDDPTPATAVQSTVDSTANENEN